MRRELSGNYGDGGNGKEERRKPGVKLLHGKDDGGDGSARNQRECGTCAAGHDISAPTLVFFASQHAYYAFSHGSSHLDARSFCAEGKSAQKAEPGRDGKNKNTFVPMKTGNAANCRNGGRNSAAATAVRKA